MEHGTSSNINRLVRAQRLAADLMELAAEHGAKHDPSITVYSFGVFIRINLGDKPAAGEIAAWQLATGQVWDVETTRFMYDGKPAKTDRARVEFGDVAVTVEVTTSVASLAVAA